MKRSIIQVLVVIWIICIAGCNPHSQPVTINQPVITTGRYKCVNVWHFVIDDGNSEFHRGRICFYVALKNDKKEVFRVNNFPLFAQFEPGNWYEVKAIGVRNDEENIVPNITSVKEAEASVAEIDPKDAKDYSKITKPSPRQGF